MEHSEAISSKAAERYLLGELDDADAEAFEEHFFECAECADDVRDEAVLLETGRAIAREPKKPNVVPIARRNAPRWGWLQVAAAAILVIGIGGPLMLTRRAQPMVSVARSFTVTTDRSAAAPQVIELPKGMSGILYIPIEPGNYQYRLVDAAGESRGAGTVGTADLADGFGLVLPGDLPAGQYKVTIDGVRAEDGKTVTFTIIRK